MAAKKQGAIKHIRCDCSMSHHIGRVHVPPQPDYAEMTKEELEVYIETQAITMAGFEAHVNFALKHNEQYSSFTRLLDNTKTLNTGLILDLRNRIEELEQNAARSHVKYSQQETFGFSMFSKDTSGLETELTHHKKEARDARGKLGEVRELLDKATSSHNMVLTQDGLERLAANMDEYHRQNSEVCEHIKEATIELLAKYNDASHSITNELNQRIDELKDHLRIMIASVHEIEKKNLEGSELQTAEINRLKQEVKGLSSNHEQAAGELAETNTTKESLDKENRKLKDDVRRYSDILRGCRKQYHESDLRTKQKLKEKDEAMSEMRLRLNRALQEASSGLGRAPAQSTLKPPVQAINTTAKRGRPKSGSKRAQHDNGSESNLPPASSPVAAVSIPDASESFSHAARQDEQTLPVTASEIVQSRLHTTGPNGSSRRAMAQHQRQLPHQHLSRAASAQPSGLQNSFPHPQQRIDTRQNDLSQSSPPMQQALRKQAHVNASPRSQQQNNLQLQQQAIQSQAQRLALMNASMRNQAPTPSSGHSIRSMPLPTQNSGCSVNQDFPQPTQNSFSNEQYRRPAVTHPSMQRQPRIPATGPEVSQPPPQRPINGNQASQSFPQQTNYVHTGGQYHQSASFSGSPMSQGPHPGQPQGWMSWASPTGGMQSASQSQNNPNSWHMAQTPSPAAGNQSFQQAQTLGQTNPMTLTPTALNRPRSTLPVQRIEQTHCPAPVTSSPFERAISHSIQPRYPEQWSNSFMMPPRENDFAFAGTLMSNAGLNGHDSSQASPTPSSRVDFVNIPGPQHVTNGYGPRRPYTTASTAPTNAQIAPFEHMSNGGYNQPTIHNRLQDSNGMFGNGSVPNTYAGNKRLLPSGFEDPAAQRPRLG